jgi:hypothetical protein
MPLAHRSDSSVTAGTPHGLPDGGAGVHDDIPAGQRLLEGKADGVLEEGLQNQEATPLLWEACLTRNDGEGAPVDPQEIVVEDRNNALGGK